MNENFNGFRMPAEWEPQNSVWIAWPYNKNDWPGLYQFIPEVILKIIKKISRNQKTGEKVNTPEKKTIHFKMSKDLFKKLNNNEE